ncbi:hypothetical protein F2P81_023778 [Scophthalmus maximus]|uniref:Uncharacterized protein n=1 Tax=Scophthalmus maximus TaxID=52904 RepID=A0A6A4RSY0_SCOMX|nr:hypothetical protein F2P81_023778 [Scophthalmus maximus]
MQTHAGAPTKSCRHRFSIFRVVVISSRWRRHTASFDIFCLEKESAVSPFSSDVLVLLLSANDSVLSDPAEEPHTYVPQEVETKSDRERLEMGLMDGNVRVDIFGRSPTLVRLLLKSGESQRVQRIDLNSGYGFVLNAVAEFAGRSENEQEIIRQLCLEGQRLETFAEITESESKSTFVVDKARNGLANLVSFLSVPDWRSPTGAVGVGDTVAEVSSKIKKHHNGMISSMQLKCFQYYSIDGKDKTHSPKSEFFTTFPLQIKDEEHLQISPLHCVPFHLVVDLSFTEDVVVSQRPTTQIRARVQLKKRRDGVWTGNRAFGGKDLSIRTTAAASSVAKLASLKRCSHVFVNGQQPCIAPSATAAQ